MHYTVVKEWSTKFIFITYIFPKRQEKKPCREGYEAVPSPRQPSPGNQTYTEGMDHGLINYTDTTAFVGFS